MEVPGSMTRGEKIAFYTNKIGELVDERVDKFLREVELRKERERINEDKERLNSEIAKIAEKLIELTS